MEKIKIYVQLRPYLVDHTGSRSISKVKLRRALLVLRLETTWEHQGAVVFFFNVLNMSTNLQLELLEALRASIIASEISTILIWQRQNEWKRRATFLIHMALTWSVILPATTYDSL